MNRIPALLIRALPALLLAACATTSPSVPSEAIDPAPSAQAPVLLAAGDIAACDSNGDEATAELLDDLEGTVLTLGDNAYPDGTAADFANCYAPSWGRHRDRTYPSAGNHDYETSDAAAYFAYFGDRAGVPGEGWYSFDLGAWHLIALNSTCDEIGGCGPDSPQAEWLRADLAANPTACTLAYWHHPRWSSGETHGSDPRTDPLWRILHDAGADLVLTAHDHLYERFLPMNANGNSAPGGMTEFVVGTGGRSLYAFDQPLPTSAARDNSAFGILKLTLHADAYDWQFVAASATEFVDAGSSPCR